MRKSLLLGLLISLSLPCLAGETASIKGLYRYEVPSGYSRAEQGPGELNYLAPRADNYQSSVTIKSAPVRQGYGLKTIGDMLTQGWKESDRNTEFAEGKLVKVKGNDVYIVTCLYRLNEKVLTGQYHAIFLKDRQLVIISFGALSKDVELGKKFLRSLETFRWLR